MISSSDKQGAENIQPRSYDKVSWCVSRCTQFKLDVFHLENESMIINEIHNDYFSNVSIALPLIIIFT